MSDNRKISALTNVTSLPATAYLPIVDPAEVADADKNKRWTPRQAAVADVDDAALPADGAIAGRALPADGDIEGLSLPDDGVIAALTFSSTPTQAECEALRDFNAALQTECEELRDALAQMLTDGEALRDTIAALVTTVETLRDRLKATGGCGILADS